MYPEANMDSQYAAKPDSETYLGSDQGFLIWVPRSRYRESTKQLTLHPPTSEVQVNNFMPRVGKGSVKQILFKKECLDNKHLRTPALGHKKIFTASFIF